VEGKYGRINVTLSHITFVGKGKDETTIRGGFLVDNQQNVNFEALTITNPNLIAGHGLLVRGSETNVEVLNCAVKKCGNTGMDVRTGATVKVQIQKQD
jgi:pectate lyase